MRVPIWCMSDMYKCGVCLVQVALVQSLLWGLQFRTLTSMLVPVIVIGTFVAAIWRPLSRSGMSRALRLATGRERGAHVAGRA
jgi:hypothetical protein